MEVIYPSSKCEVNGAHYYIEAISLSGIFQCKYCKVVKWQPVYWSDAVKFSDLIKKYKSIDKAYNESLKKRSKTRHIIEALSDMAGMVVSAEDRQELRKENVEAEGNPWGTTEMGEGVVSGRQKRIGKNRKQRVV